MKIKAFSDKNIFKAMVYMYIIIVQESILNKTNIVKIKLNKNELNQI